MEKKKILFIGLAVVIVAVVVFGLVSVVNAVNNNKQRNLLVEDLNSLNDLTSASDLDLVAIREKLNTTVTTGEYVPVEEALKAYLSDVIDVVDEMFTIAAEEELGNLLSAENYAEDGPEFKATKQYISEKITQLEGIKNKVTELLSEEKIMSYIEAKDVKNKYKKIFKELAFENSEVSQEEVDEAIDTLISMLEKSNVILDFLTENKNSWQVQGKNIVFATDELVTQYNKYLTELN